MLLGLLCGQADAGTATLEVRASCTIESGGSHWERVARSSRRAYINIDTAIANALSDILSTYVRSQTSDDEPQQMKEYSASAICTIIVNGTPLRQVSRKSMVRGPYYAQEDAIGESVFKAFVAAGLPVATK